MLAQNANDDFLQHALALELIKTGNDDEAKKLFENILNNNPGYVGSYYHLAKLLERKGDYDAAITVYKNGMDASKTAGDKHAENELRMAYEEISDEF